MYSVDVKILTYVILHMWDSICVLKTQQILFQYYSILLHSTISGKYSKDSRREQKSRRTTDLRWL